MTPNLPHNMTTAWLASGVHMAWLDDDVVVLDVRSDAYSCIVDGRRLLRPSPTCPDAVAIAREVSHDLVAAGLVAAIRPNDRRRRAARPTRSSLPVSQARGGAAVRAGLASLEAGLRFRRLSLEAAIQPEILREPPGAIRQRPHEDLTAAFLTALPWIPAQGRCLQRAYALRRLLAREGIQADWVFGVRTWPFLAHCWLQIGDLVLADDLDRVRGFTPILTT